MLRHTNCVPNVVDLPNASHHSFLTVGLEPCNGRKITSVYSWISSCADWADTEGKKYTFRWNNRNRLTTGLIFQEYETNHSALRRSKLLPHLERIRHLNVSAHTAGNWTRQREINSQPLYANETGRAYKCLRNLLCSPHDLILNQYKGKRSRIVLAAFAVLEEGVKDVII